MLQVDLVHLSFLPNLELRLSPFLGTQKISENRQKLLKIGITSGYQEEIEEAKRT